jgi:hypothetical protein
MSEPLEPKPNLRLRLWRHVKRNFLGYVALIVAVSMTPLPAYAATKIGAKQIKNGAVTTAKIKNGAVTAPKIGAGAVSGPAIAAGAVNGSAIADGSIGAADLGSGAAYRDLVFKEFTEAGVASGDYSSKYIICPTGYVAIGGGASTYITPNAGTLQMSVPVKQGAILTLPTTDGQVPDGWRTDVLVTSGTQSVYHYAICASK